MTWLKLQPDVDRAVTSSPLATLARAVFSSWLSIRATCQFSI
jgi:hypothetical protein